MAGGTAGLAIKQTMEDAAHNLALAKVLEAEAKKLKADAHEVLFQHMSPEFKEYTSDHSKGSIVYIPAGETKTFSKEAAAQGLLSKGVPATTIHDVWNASVTIKPRAAYIKWVPAK